MRLLISVDNLDDALRVASRPVDILDLKNPAEGSLGAAPPWLVSEVARETEKSATKVRISVALGDLHDQPGTAALAAAGAAACGAHFVKAGLRWLGSQRRAEQLLQAVRRAAQDVNSKCLVVAAGYGDYREINGLPPQAIVAAAAAAKVDVVMLDTAQKDGRSLLDVLPQAELARFLRDANAAGLRVALAGSLRPADLPRLSDMCLEFIGVRGAVCQGNDRRQPVCLEKLDALLGQLPQAAPAKPGLGSVSA